MDKAKKKLFEKRPHFEGENQSAVIFYGIFTLRVSVV